MMKEDTQLIQGPAGQLEIAIRQPTTDARRWGIVCHPHPLFGGAMNNKVVTTLAKTFEQLGLTVVRFNFRGVGKSEGRFDNGIGELNDLFAVIDWTKQQHPEREIWLAGFSFGAFIAAKAATILPIHKLVTVAPPVQHFPMQTLAPITCPWILVQGELDEVVPPQAVFEWAESRVPAPIIIRFPQATHFFHGQLGELRTTLEDVLQE